MAPRTKKADPVPITKKEIKALKELAPCAPLHGKSRIRSLDGRCVFPDSTALTSVGICLPRVIKYKATKTKPARTKMIEMVANPTYTSGSGQPRCLRAGGRAMLDRVRTRKESCDPHTQIYKDITYTVPKVPKGENPTTYWKQWKKENPGKEVPTKKVKSGRCIIAKGANKRCEIGQELIHSIMTVKKGKNKGKTFNTYRCAKAGVYKNKDVVKKGDLPVRFIKTRETYDKERKFVIHGGYDHPVIAEGVAPKKTKKVTGGTKKRTAPKPQAKNPKKAQAAASSSVPLAVRGAAKTTASKGKVTAAAKAKAAKAKAAAAAKTKAAKAKAAAAAAKAKAAAAKAPKGKTAAAKAAAAKAAKAKAAKAAKAIEIVNETSSVQASVPKATAPKAKTPKSKAPKAAKGKGKGKATAPTTRQTRSGAKAAAAPKAAAASKGKGKGKAATQAPRRSTRVAAALAAV